MSGQLVDLGSDPIYRTLYKRLKEEMDGVEITDLRPWMTRAAEIYNELREDL